MANLENLTINDHSGDVDGGCCYDKAELLEILGLEEMTIHMTTEEQGEGDYVILAKKVPSEWIPFLRSGAWEGDTGNYSISLPSTVVGHVPAYEDNCDIRVVIEDLNKSGIPLGTTIVPASHTGDYIESEAFSNDLLFVYYTNDDRKLELHNDNYEGHAPRISYSSVTFEYKEV